MRYSTPELNDGVLLRAVEHKDGEVLRYDGRLWKRRFILTITPGTCSDGMSDTVYKYTSTLTYRGKTEKGCARLK